ncbi:MAG: hypothetical protein WBI14_02555, partial [Anaerolineaceae bacterium]
MTFDRVGSFSKSKRSSPCFELTATSYQLSIVPRRVGSALEPTNSLARRIAYEIASPARNDGGLPLVNEGRQAAQTVPRR